MATFGNPSHGREKSMNSTMHTSAVAPTSCGEPCRAGRSQPRCLIWHQSWTSCPNSAVVLEVGSGPGGITLDIAQRYPHLHVFGVDIDDASLKLAEDALQAAGIRNLQYKQGDAVNLSALASCPGFEFVVGGCDLVYTNAVGTLPSVQL
ncbi:hypothetical protein MRB53_041033 [Persea americana]|nr:hypothetical protein MRB53_041033 [Persea americana]